MLERVMEKAQRCSLYSSTNQQTNKRMQKEASFCVHVSMGTTTAFLSLGKGKDFRENNRPYYHPRFKKPSLTTGCPSVTTI